MMTEKYLQVLWAKVETLNFLNSEISRAIRDIQKLTNIENFPPDREKLTARVNLLEWAAQTRDLYQE